MLLHIVYSFSLLYNILLYKCTIVYPFYCGLIFELFSILILKNKVPMYTLEHIFGEKKHSFLFGVYPGVEWFGHRISVHLVLIDTVVFPMKLHQFTFSPAMNNGSKLLYKWTSKSVINVASREYSILLLLLKS